MCIQVKWFKNKKKSGIDTLQTFAAAVLVFCFVSSFGKDEAVNPPEQPIDGATAFGIFVVAFILFYFYLTVSSIFSILFQALTINVW